MTNPILSPSHIAVDSPTTPSPLTQFMVVRMDVYHQLPYLDSLCVGETEAVALAEAHLNDGVVNDPRWVGQNPVVGAVAVEIRVVTHLGGKV